MDVLEGNKLIAKFLKFYFRDENTCQPIRGWVTGSENMTYNPETYLKFHSSWDWLMPVIDKIEALDMSDHHYKWGEGEEEHCNFMGFEFDMRPLTNGYAASIYMELQLDPPERVGGDYNKKYPTRIEAAWNTVVEFIQYYNEFMNMQEQISIYDFLGRAGGMELGAKVYAEFGSEYPDEKVGRRLVENKKYNGYVDLYPRWFLEQYFANTSLKDIPGNHF